MKKIITTIIAVIMCATLPAALAATFNDVKSTDWYYNDVEEAVRLKLVNGTSATTFSPNDNLTIAEAVKLAAVMHELSVTGKITLTGGDPWYEPYVDYAKNMGIITQDYSWDNAIARGLYMDIFSRALPQGDLLAINSVEDGSIPDITSTNPYIEGIYLLYRAGVVQGSDAARSAKPYDSILRSEVAAIVNRMMNDDKRISFTLGQETDELRILSQPVSSTVNVLDIVQLSVSVQGGQAPYNYMWQVQGTDGTWVSATSRAGVTNANTKSMSVFVDSDTHWSATEAIRCVITDAHGTVVTSSSAKITIKATEPALEITAQPMSAIDVAMHDIVSFTVTAAGGEGPYTYEWQANSDALGGFTAVSELIGDFDGANEAVLSLVTTEEWAKAEFRCIITDANSNETISDAVGFTIKGTTGTAEIPVITTEPKTQHVSRGQSATLEVTATSKNPLSYNWQYNNGSGWKSFSNATDADQLSSNTKTSSLIVESGNVNTDGNIEYRCVISDDFGGEVISEAVTVETKIEIGDHGQDYIHTTGTQSSYHPDTFEVKLASTEKRAVGYQWHYSIDGNTWSDVTDDASKGIIVRNDSAQDAKLQVELERNYYTESLQFRCTVYKADDPTVKTISTPLKVIIN